MRKMVWSEERRGIQVRVGLNWLSTEIVKEVLRKKGYLV